MAALFDLGGIISGIIREHNLDKYARMVLAMAVAGFVAYYATNGATGVVLVQAGKDVSVAGFLARCAGYTAMASAVWTTWSRNKPKGVETPAPPGLTEGPK